MQEEELRKTHADEIWDDRNMCHKHPMIPMEDFHELRTELDRTRIDFLKIDLETAMTMVEIARGGAVGSEKRTRNIENARRAYETVMKFHKQVRSSSQEEKEIGEKLNVLKTALTSLGATL